MVSFVRSGPAWLPLLKLRMNRRYRHPELNLKKKIADTWKSSCTKHHYQDVAGVTRYRVLACRRHKYVEGDLMHKKWKNFQRKHTLSAALSALAVITCAPVTAQNAVAPTPGMQARDASERQNT